MDKASMHVLMQPPVRLYNIHCHYVPAILQCTGCPGRELAHGALHCCCTCILALA